MSSTDPAMLRILGKEGTFGEYIGLSNDWAVRIIKAVGNYRVMREMLVLTLHYNLTEV